MYDDDRILTVIAWNLRGYTGFVWGGCAWLVSTHEILCWFTVSTDADLLIFVRNRSLSGPISVSQRRETAPSTSSTSSSPSRYPLGNSPRLMWMLSTSTTITSLLSDTQLLDNHLVDPHLFHRSPVSLPITAVLRMLRLKDVAASSRLVKARGRLRSHRLLLSTCTSSPSRLHVQFYLAQPRLERKYGHEGTQEVSQSQDLGKETTRP